MTTRFLYFLLLFLPLSFSSCLEDDDSTTPGVCEEGLIPLQEFAAADTVTYTELNSTGLFYSIEEEGSDDKPTLQDTVTVNYSGMVTNGRVFDQTTTASGPITFPLRNLIEGWQLGIPLVGRGGKVRLLIPSALGYGSAGSCRNGFCTICPDSDLVFDIELVDF